MSFSFLKRSKEISPNITRNSPKLLVDMHTHILPLIDNGPHTLEESILLLKKMAADGVKKVIATPHIMADFYGNTPERINFLYEHLDYEIKQLNLPIKLDIAAEYYLDDFFINIVKEEQPLLLIKNTYLLLETGLVNIHPKLWEVVELLRKRNITVILAHPERYNYLQQNFDFVEKLYHHVLFQINLNSWVSTHNATRTLAERIVKEGFVSFVGSNVHSIQEWNIAKDQLNTNIYEALLKKGIKNHLLQ